MKRKTKRKLLWLWIGFLIGVISTIGILTLSNHLK